MRALAIAAVVAAGAGTAGAQGWSEPDPVALVGHWTGTAVWRSCAVTGHARVALDVIRDGSGYRVDLAPLLDGLGAERFAPIGGPVVEAARADLHATWTMGKADRAVVRLGLGAACRATVTLRRASLGVPACDELRGLRAVATTCASLADRPPPTADATLARLVPGRKVAARPRAAAEAVCRAEATPLRAALTAAGCVPAPIDPDAGPAIPACDALVATVVRATRCDRIPVEAKQRLTEQIRFVAKSTAVTDPGAREELVQTCELTRTQLVETLTLLGCP